MQAPGPGNRHDKIDFKWTVKKPRAASMHVESEKTKEKDSRLARIAKDKAQLAPGEYQDQKAFIET